MPCYHMCKKKNKHWRDLKSHEINANNWKAAPCRFYRETLQMTQTLRIPTVNVFPIFKASHQNVLFYDM